MWGENVYLHLPSRHWMKSSGQLHIYVALLPGRKSPCYPVERRLVGPHGRFRHCGEEKDLVLGEYDARAFRTVGRRCTELLLVTFVAQCRVLIGLRIRLRFSTGMKRKPDDETTVISIRSCVSTRNRVRTLNRFCL
jgi:hypothetical protein